MGGSRCHIQKEKQEDLVHLHSDFDGVTTSPMNLVKKCFGSRASMFTQASAASTAATFIETPKSSRCGTEKPLLTRLLQPQELVRRVWEVECNTWSSPAPCGCIWILGVMISSWSPTPSLDAVP